MKKKIIALILLICVCFFASACEDEEKKSIYSENESESIVNTDAPASKSPKEAKIALYNTYKTSVQTYSSGSSFKTMYSLFDIDGNSIPELIYIVDNGKYKAYSYDGKIMVYSGGFKSKEGLFTYDKKLFATTGNDSYKVYAKISLDSTFKIYDIGYPFITAEMPASGSGKYTYDKEEITQERYNEIISSMKPLETYPLSDLSHLEVLLK